MTSSSPGLLAGTVKDPPHTRQSPRTLAAFRPWGGWRDERRARGLAASLAAGRGVREPARDPVSHSRRRGDDGRIAELPAQAPDGDRDGVRERISELVPDLLEQVFGAQIGRAGPQQGLEHAEFLDRQVKLTAIPARGSPDRVELDRGRAQYAPASGGLPPSEGLDPQDQLGEMERLREVVVGAEAESADAVAGLAGRRQHQDHDSV